MKSSSQPQQLTLTSTITSDTNLLRSIALQLDKWAEESVAGGWSTHQVKPMRELANQIFGHLGRTQR